MQREKDHSDVLRGERRKETERKVAQGERITKVKKVPQLHSVAATAI